MTLHTCDSDICSDIDRDSDSEEIIIIITMAVIVAYIQLIYIHS